MPQFDCVRSVRPMVAKLAAASDEQIRSRRSGARFAVDVLEDADLIFETAVGSNGRGLSLAEKEVVSALHREVESIVDDEGPGSSFWTDAALKSDPKWEAIRVAARQALRELDELRGLSSPSA